MYLLIIILPLLGSILSGLFGRKIGVSGSQIITTTLVIITTLLAILAYLEVGLNNIPVSLKLIRWVDSESLNISWAFHFDALTVSMLLPVLVVSSLVHLYSISYMSHDPRYNGDKIYNSRNFLKLMISNFNRKVLGGWNSYSGKVINHKLINNEMSYHGSKSDFINIKSVKEQLVYNIWYTNRLVYLRNTLMSFERNYQIKYLFKQLNKKNFFYT